MKLLLFVGVFLIVASVIMFIQIFRPSSKPSSLYDGIGMLALSAIMFLVGVVSLILSAFIYIGVAFGLVS